MNRWMTAIGSPRAHERWRAWVRWLPELEQGSALAAELAANPFWRRPAVLGWRRRTNAWALLALCTLALFGVSSVLAESSPLLRPWTFVLAIYVPVRCLALYRAARSASGAVRRELTRPGFEHVLLAPLSPRDFQLGLAAAGWRRCVPETVLLFALLYPWTLTMGLAGMVVPWLELASVAVLQALGAVIAAKLALKRAQHREAASAGWVSTAFTYPQVFFLQSLLFSALFMTPPLAFALLLAGPESPWREGLLDFLPRGILYALLAAYYLWLPCGALREIQRHLTTEAPTLDDLRYHAEPPAHEILPWSEFKRR